MPTWSRHPKAANSGFSSKAVPSLRSKDDVEGPASLLKRDLPGWRGYRYWSLAACGSGVSGLGSIGVLRLLVKLVEHTVPIIVRVGLVDPSPE